METINIDSNNLDLVNFDYLKSKDDSSETIVLIDGSGGNRLKLRPLAEYLNNKFNNKNVVAISFSGTETRVSYPPKTQFDDLKSVLNYLIENKENKKFDLVCTSMGSVSTVFVLNDKDFDKYISNVIMLDPADYLIDIGEKEGKTWTGYEKYDFEANTLSKLMSNITSDVKVHVINFKIRNYSDKGYAPDSERGIDNPKLYSRLNNEMVEVFYERTPHKNHGMYIEDEKLPHAFLRDGNIKKNIKTIHCYLEEIFDWIRIINRK